MNTFKVLVLIKSFFIKVFDDVTCFQTTVGYMFTLAVNLQFRIFNILF